MRNRLYDFRTQCDPSDIGFCIPDMNRIAFTVNQSQRRLLMCREISDEGWMGTWAEMAFSVSQTYPYITLPRDVARIVKMNVCQRPVQIQNQFYEYLAFGDGNLPKTCFLNDRGCKWGVTAYTRNNAVTFIDLTSAPQFIRIYPQDTTGSDIGKRVLIQGIDSSGNHVYSLDNNYQVSGVFAALVSPFVDVTVLGLPLAFNSILGIQKDVTVAPIQIFQVDPITGAEVLLHIMEPTEKVASYRRYYLNSLPANCCNQTTGSVAVSAIAKLELVPVVADTDYLLIQNIEALMEECKSLRYSKVDSMSAKQMADYHHRAAIRLLQGELVHYMGKEKPAMSFHPFGSFDPAAAGIGMI